MIDECQHTFYSIPLARYSFLDFHWTKLEHDTRLAYFHQTLLGLSAMHEQGLVHGNIRPSSLLVLANATHKSYTTTKALSTKKAVLSLSMSQTERKLYDTTSICIAPEVWEKINGRPRADLDEAKLDIWALATSWLYTFMRPPDNFKIETERDYLQMRGQVQYRIQRISSLGTFAPLLHQMLAWKPEQRPSAAEALRSTAWQSVWDEKRRREDEMKQKRKAKAQSDGTKRVRVLSPGAEDYKTIESDTKQD
ncbi:kinase-like domain-containing protein [Trichoderma sp. SZMC 28014]